MTISLRCADCGFEAEYQSEQDAYDDNWWQSESGEWYCEDCYSHCDDCDDTFPNRDMTYMENLDRNVCDGCIENYRHCDHCNNWALEHETWTIIVNNQEEFWCPDCKNRADANNELRWEDEYIIYAPQNNQSGEGHTYQQNLHPEVWAEIRNCKECHERGDKCPKCLKREAEEKEAEETNLWIYNDNASPYHSPLNFKFKATKYREKHEHPFLYYGIENELLFNSREPIDKIAKEYIQATGGLFVAEYDRSVTNLGNGIEFISKALSYKKWSSEEVYQRLEAGNKVLEKYHAFRPQSEGCGLHVHMSLRFFEENTKKKVKEIKSDIDWIFQIFQPEMEKFSRRKYTRYCASKAYRLKEIMKNLRNNGYGFNLNPTMTLTKGNITQSLGSGDTHHDAIIQTNKTIEIRTFRSTIETEEILATIEFCRAIAHAARNMKLTKDTTLGDILYCKDSKYLDGYIKKYKIDTNAKFANKLEVKL